MKRQKPGWIDILNRLDMAARLYRITKCILEVGAWLIELVSPPDG